MADTPDMALIHALEGGNYPAALRAMRRGATLQGHDGHGQALGWQPFLIHGVRHLDWMLDHAGPPTASEVWPELLGQAVLANRLDLAQALLDRGASPSGLTRGHGNALLYALRSPADAPLAWVLAQGVELPARHDPYAVVLAPSYPLSPDVIIAGAQAPSVARIQQMAEQGWRWTLPSPLRALNAVAGSIPADQFLGVWQALVALGASPEAPGRSIPTSLTVCDVARRGPHGAHFRHWEGSTTRYAQLQALPRGPGQRRHRS